MPARRARTLKRSFYARPTLQVLEELIGKVLVHDLRGGRWVEGCLEHGRPGVHLERSGRVWGSCRIPRSARGRAWTYRLVLAAPSSAWPWSTPSSASSSVLLPR